jgi:REP element-mobilizing transposase RayT
MTAPRQVLPGTTYLVTRRCSERRFFLRPSKDTNDRVLYLLAVAARRFGMLVHACCAMSNHLHLVVTDPHAQLPRFMQYFNSLVARSVNVSIGRFEGFWAKDTGYSAVVPLERADVVAKCAYVLANPVAAGLVRTGRDWPGLRLAALEAEATKVVARRPAHFFSKKGHMPAEIELELTSPPQFPSAAEFGSLLTEEVAQLEEQHRREFDDAGRKFLGVARVLAQNPFARPAVRAARFRLNPRLAARDKWKRVEAIGKLKTFLQQYRDAWRARRRGIEGVLFPAGTYLMRVLHGAPCADVA